MNCVLVTGATGTVGSHLVHVLRERGVLVRVFVRDPDKAAAMFAPGNDLTVARCALPPDASMTIPIFDTVLKGISIIGSIVGTRQDLVEVFDLHAAGRTRVVAAGRKLDDVNAAIDEVLSGTVAGRIVFEF
jgi:D-arabinose 1-dehydrogenase-like Zn-dependent alcohol dehydrogenase